MTCETWINRKMNRMYDLKGKLHKYKCIYLYWPEGLNKGGGIQITLKSHWNVFNMFACNL